MSYLPCLSLFTFSDVHHILCCVCLRIVCPVLPVSLDCSFFIAHSVFSNVSSDYAHLTQLLTIFQLYIMAVSTIGNETRIISGKPFKHAVVSY